MLLPKDSIVMAVDGSRMSAFRNIGDAFEPDLELIETVKNPSLRTSEMGADKAGRTFKSKSPRRGTHEMTDLHELEEERFARDIAKQIEERAVNNDVRIVLVAAPRTLGVIRKELKGVAHNLLMAEIPKSFGPDDAAPLARMIANHKG